MSRVEIIDQEYRLQPQDLAGAPRRLVVANVTLQGVEEMAPTLHFVGQTKRLTLTPEQSRVLVELTGAPRPRDWIGATVVLEPRQTREGPVIAIVAPQQRRRAGKFTVPLDREQRQWRSGLVIVAFLLAAGGLYFVLNLQPLLAILAGLR